MRDQGSTGACVGFGTADGVLHWHYREAGLLAPGERPSPRFIWMANKETDRIRSYPTSFIESAGTQTKLALRVARRYGCVLESTLPMSGRLSPLSTAAFYTRAAKYRIASYHNLRRNRAAWRRWLCHQGPILARVVVDRTCAGSGMMLASEVSNARSSLRAFGFLPWAAMTGAIMRVSARY